MDWQSFFINTIRILFMNGVRDTVLNADAELETVQDLFGHSWITTKQRYCRFSNQTVKADYFRAMQVVIQKTGISVL